MLNSFFSLWIITSSNTPSLLLPLSQLGTSLLSHRFRCHSNHVEVLISCSEISWFCCQRLGPGNIVVNIMIGYMDLYTPQSIALAEMFGRYSRPVHMFTASAGASKSGQSFLSDIWIVRIFSEQTVFFMLQFH